MRWIPLPMMSAWESRNPGSRKIAARAGRGVLMPFTTEPLTAEQELYMRKLERQHRKIVEAFAHAGDEQAIKQLAEMNAGTKSTSAV